MLWCPASVRNIGVGPSKAQYSLMDINFEIAMCWGKPDGTVWNALERQCAMTRDARLSALHRGGFGLAGPRFRLLRRPPSYNGGQVPSGSVQRAPRTQVVVPGGRGPCLPRRAVTSRRRRTPRLAPHSGSSLEHALNERGWEIGRA